MDNARDGRWGRQSRVVALLAAACLMLAACGESGTRAPEIASAADARQGGIRSQGVVVTDSFRAYAGADEGFAAEAARDALNAGGNAVDAVVAGYFALAVTLPSAASLGAHGACVVHLHGTRTAAAFGFPSVPAGRTNGGPVAVPTAVRGVALMHLRHGKLRWEQLVAPAERLARAGVPVSPGLARDLQAAGLSSPGSVWLQPDLAAVLGALRQSGGGDFAQGRLARQLAEQSAPTGAGLSLDTIRAAIPIAGPTVTEAFGSHRVHGVPAPLGGPQALAAWRGGAAATGAGGGVAGVVAVDSEASAAACSFSMGVPFGARTVVPGMGIWLAAPGGDPVSPLIVANPANGEFFFAGVARSGSQIGAFARAALAGDGAVEQAFASRGAGVTAIACPRGLRGNQQSCRAGTDPGGFGLVVPALGR